MSILLVYLPSAHSSVDYPSAPCDKLESPRKGDQELCIRQELLVRPQRQLCAELTHRGIAFAGLLARRTRQNTHRSRLCIRTSARTCSIMHSRASTHVFSLVRRLRIIFIHGTDSFDDQMAKRDLVSNSNCAGQTQETLTRGLSRQILFHDGLWS